MKINDVLELRQLYAQASGRAVQKQLAQLEKHSESFLGLSPFCTLSTYSALGTLDCSPRGGKPGFVRVINQKTIAIADASGNNRLDTLTNIVETGKIGCLFLVPGIDETLRINGNAYISVDPMDLTFYSGAKNMPKSVIIIEIQELYLHCAKSLMRSKLWHQGSIQDRDILPTMARMIADQVDDKSPLETQQQMIARYTQQL